MVQTNRGTKCHCGACGASFYDLNRVPVICPKCQAAYVAPSPRLPVRAPTRPMPRSQQPVLAEQHEVGDAFAEDEVLAPELDSEVEDEDEDEDEIAADDDADESGEEGANE